MNSEQLNSHIIAYYVSTHGKDLNIMGRYYPYGELVLVLEDKVKVATRKFGLKVKSQVKSAATQLLDLMIAQGAFTTKQNDFGGTMHQFQPDAYRQLLSDLNEKGPVLIKARDAGPEFWEQAFAELTA